MFNTSRKWYAEMRDRKAVFNSNLDFWRTFIFIVIWQWEIVWGINRIKFNFIQRAKSTWYSIKALGWHKPCFECYGSGVKWKYSDIQDCPGCAGGAGYIRVGFWYDMKCVFYPDLIIYKIKKRWRNGK